MIPHTQQLCFVDIETTGLDPSLDCILEVAAAVLDVRSGEVVQSFQALIEPYGLRCVKVGRVWAWDLPEFHAQHFAAVDWSLAIPLSEALAGIWWLLQDRAVAGQNPGFDLSFLKPAMIQHTMVWPADYHQIDTVTIGHVLMRLGLSEGVSLKHTRVWAGCEGEQKHRAMADVEDTIRVYTRFTDMVMSEIKKVEGV